MHQIDNCLESTGGDILEMSCTAIVSIPLVLGCMKAVSVSRCNRQGGPHGGVGWGGGNLLWFSSAGLNCWRRNGCSEGCHNFCHLFKVKLRWRPKSQEHRTTYILQMSALWKSALLKIAMCSTTFTPLETLNAKSPL